MRVNVDEEGVAEPVELDEEMDPVERSVWRWTTLVRGTNWRLVGIGGRMGGGSFGPVAGVVGAALGCCGNAPGAGADLTGAGAVLGCFVAGPESGAFDSVG
jgi:hypothetical protein